MIHKLTTVIYDGKTIEKGTVFVNFKGRYIGQVAAGNSEDACGYSPARMSKVIIVGASTRTDEMLADSNTGTCIDIIAPGEAIKSNWHTELTATTTWHVICHVLLLLFLS